MDEPYLLSVALHFASWAALRACTVNLLLEQQKTVNSQVTRECPSAALDFVWAYLHHPRAWTTNADRPHLAQSQPQHLLSTQLFTFTPAVVPVSWRAERFWWSRSMSTL